MVFVCLVDIIKICGTNMIITMLEKMEEEQKKIKARLDELESENKFLRELVTHLASQPAPYQPDPYGPPYKVTC